MKWVFQWPFSRPKTKDGSSGFAKVKKRLEVAFSAGDHRVSDAQDREVGFFDHGFGPREDALTGGLILHKTARGFLGCSFKLGLHEHHDVCVLGHAFGDFRQDLVQRDERHVGHDQAGLIGNFCRVHIAEVGSLKDVDACVFAQIIIQESVTDINRPHGLGTRLQQAVCKTAGRRPYVETDSPLNRDIEVIQRATELMASAGDELWLCLLVFS